MFKAIVDRVFKSYKSTLVGLGIGIALIVLDQLAIAAQSSAKPWVQALAGIVVLLGASLKSKALPPAEP